jgi:hypothetical protein
MDFAFSGPVPRAISAIVMNIRGQGDMRRHDRVAVEFSDEMRAETVSGGLLGRLGPAEDVADVDPFPASADPTGNVDGGLPIH